MMRDPGFGLCTPSSSSRKIRSGRKHMPSRLKSELFISMKLPGLHTYCRLSKIMTHSVKTCENTDLKVNYAKVLCKVKIEYQYLPD